MKTLYIIDGSGFIYRSYYAIHSLMNSKRLPTNAVLGFANIFIKTLAEKKPDYCAIVWDSPEPSFRKDLFELYKAHRPKMPEDLIVQIPYIKKLVNAFNIYSIEKSTFEADDIIATMVNTFANHQIQIVIASSDKDLMSLVGDRVTLWDPMKDKMITEKEVVEKCNVRPEQIHGWLSLAGDASDNIPGVPGIGPKKAATLINHFGTVSNLIQNIETVSGDNLRKSIKDNLELLKISAALVALKKDIPIAFDLNELEIHAMHKSELKELLMELEFYTLLNRLNLDVMDATPITKYATVLTSNQLDHLCNMLLAQKIAAFDVETTGLDIVKSKLVGFSLCFKKGDAFYIPLQHVKTDLKQLELKVVLEKLKPFFEDPDIRWIAHNAKYDYQILANHGIKIQNIHFDTIIASYLVDGGRHGHSLKDLSLRYLHQQKTSFAEIVKGDEKKLLSFEEVSIDVATQYCAMDSDLTWQLYEMYRKKIEDGGISNLFYEIEMPLCRILAEMELEGIMIDEPYLRKLSKQFEKEIQFLEASIFKSAGTEFNIQSPKQLSEILFTKMHCPVVKKTKSGYSTDEEVLSILSENYEIASLLLQYRGKTKLKSTYIDSLLELQDSQNRVHTSYLQTATATGRLSSNSPNLQNIPIKTEDGKKIRRAFIAKEGCVLVSADYSQIELRIMAHLSQDEELLDCFLKDIDVHTQTASLVFDIFPQFVTEEMRRKAKAINFGIIYGITPFGLSKQVGLSQSKAKELIDQYFKKYSRVKRYMEETVQFAKTKGYVTTLLGRKREISEITSGNRMVAQNAERMAMNTPIQGLAADIIKIAMVRIDRQFKQYQVRTKMLLQVHDELVFETPERELNAVLPIVKAEMENAYKLTIPVKVDIQYGSNWLDAH